MLMKPALKILNYKGRSVITVRNNYIMVTTYLSHLHLVQH